MEILTVRVYGLLVNESNEVLVSDEYIRGSYFTKFPGGGLEIGEGTRDCLKREFKEEMDLNVAIGDHLYTTDFYQPSAFRPNQQILSIYYFARALEPIKAPIRKKAFAFDAQQLAAYAEKGETETFRFIKWEEFSGETVTLPIDKIVANMVRRMDKQDIRRRTQLNF
ncbi:NUDIX hydrolase [Ferruginibacter sp.]